MKKGKKPKVFEPTREEVRAMTTFWAAAQAKAKHTMNRDERREVLKYVKKRKR